MKKLVKVTFEFDDGEKLHIDDHRAALVFQSRVNSGGILVGLEECFILEEAEGAEQPSE